MISGNIIDRFIASAKNLLGFYWERNISILTYRVNWNKSFWCYVIECISYFDVEAIVSIYINLVKEGKIPEYDVKNNYNAIPFIIDKVNSYYGKNKENVVRVLKSLYYATKDGTLTTAEMLQPKTFSKNIETYKKPENLESENIGSEGFVSDVLKVLRTLIYLIIAGAAIYGGFILYNQFGTINKRKQ